MQRLTGLTETFEQVTAQSACGISYEDTGAGLAWDRVTLRAPSEEAPLLDALSASVPPGTRLLVTAKREECPGALFRATAGVWSGGEGRIVRPPPDAILFLPERPYVPMGTLREALARNGDGPALDDARVVTVLDELGAGSLLRRAGGLDVERDWDDVLSLGEQQTIALERALLAAPRFVVLDRPTTLLGAEAAARALDLLAARSITAITFAADASLADRHDARLDIGDGGTWTFRPVEPNRAPA
jgi:putative ATP-binding cassette transporter